MAITKKYVCAFCLAPVLVGLLGQAGPPASRPRVGSGIIAGIIKSPSPITRIIAVDRQWADVLNVSKEIPEDKFAYVGNCDPKTGAFTVPGLLPGKTYDLVVWNKEGRWEGISLDYHRVVTPDQPVTTEDKASLKELVEKVPEFYDQCRILWMAADHKHATLLVELRRTRDFHSGSAGEIIYRTELWYYENLFGGWAKDANTEQVMTRWRGPGKTIPQNWQYLPQLGGIAVPLPPHSRHRHRPCRVSLPPL